MGQPRWSSARPWIVALLLWIGLTAPAAAVPSAEEQAAISQINFRRGQVNLPALGYNQNLELSSRGHAAYLSTNNTTGHFQTSTLPGFTGITPFDRISAPPYGAPAIWKEVISFGASTGVAAAEDLIQAIYHRFGIFSSRVNHIGAGVVTDHPDFGTVVVVNSAVQFAFPPPLGIWVGVYPYNLQTGVTPGFLPDNESPTGLGSNRVGYPISLHVSDDRALSVTSFTVNRVGFPALATTLLTAATDPGNTPASAAAIIPASPLEYDTVYQVSFIGKANITTPVDMTWSFRTAPLLPITFSPSQPYLGYNSSIDIEIAGGSGNYVSASNNNASLADVVFIGPHTLRVTSPGPVSGTLTVTVTDDDAPQPNTGQVTITVQPVADSTPDAFSFPPVINAALSTVVQSNSITVSGIGVPTTTISIPGGGEYSKNGGLFTKQPDTVVNGDTVRVQLTSSAVGTTTTSATLMIGGVIAIFSVTTLDTLTPSVPQGLVISNLAATALTLSWTAAADNVGVTAYRVFRGGVIRATVTGSPPTPSVNDSGLTSATPYSYTVAACDAAGHCSAQSVAVSVTTLDNILPLVPAGLSITNLAGNSLTLNWGPSTDNVGVTTYRVFRGGVIRATVTGSPPTPGFNDTGLTSATSYTYTVAACDAAGNCSIQSASVSATTPDILPPSAPAGLAISNLTATALTLSWNTTFDNVGVTVYRVFRNGTFRATVNAPVTSFGDTGLTTTTSYSYTVSACDAAGLCSGQSAAAATTTLDNIPPSVPAGLSITNLAGNSLTLSWGAANDNVAVTAYRVFRGGVFRATVTAATNFGDTGLTSATNYTYTVAACDAAGNCSTQSASVSATTPDNVPPSVPANLVATAVSGSRINLAWSASTDNVGVAAYRVFRGGVFHATVNAPATNFADTGLAALTSYSYAVAACDAAGYCSAQSGAVPATTLVAGQYVFEPILEQGFNLASNALNITLDVVSIFGNPESPKAVTSNILSIWKWNAVDGRWAFNSPQLAAAANADYAAAHNYEVLSVINPGEGYWVNSIVPVTLPTQSGTGFNWNGFSFAALPSGWSLITTADGYTPSQFNTQVSQSPPTDSFVSLWAWDAVQAKWYFYSPLLGGLPAVKSYANSRGYLHFEDFGKTLGIGTGFWVNRP